jgi:hypothetical protein
MRRREFVTLVGSAAATWPLAARSQQPSIPLIGYLEGASQAQFSHLVPAFLKGLREIGYSEGRNVRIEYRWADGQYDRLPTLAAELVVGKVTLIFTTALISALAAKAATETIPIVFVSGPDPVQLGLVATESARRQFNWRYPVHECGSGKATGIIARAIPIECLIRFSLKPCQYESGDRYSTNGDSGERSQPKNCGYESSYR